MHKVKSTHKVVLTNYSRFGSIILAKEEAPVKDSEQYFINKAIRSLRIWFSKKKLLMSQAQDLQRQLAEAWRDKEQMEAENEALRERDKTMSKLLIEIYDMIELRIPKHDALLTGEERDCHTAECTARVIAGMDCICGFTGGDVEGADDHLRGKK